MTLLVASGEITPPGSTGNVSYSGITTFTPKLILVFGNTRAAGASTVGAMYQLHGAGAATGLGVVCASWSEQNGLATSNVIGATQNNRLLRYNTANSATVRHEATLVSMDATGFTLNWATSAAADSPFQWVAFGGSDFKATVGTISTGTGTSNIAVTGVGFQPKAVLFLSGYLAAVSGYNGNAAVGMACWGAATGASARWAAAVCSDDAEATAEDTGNAVFADRVNHMFAVNQATDGALDLVSLDADGFTVVPDDGYSADAWVHYVALGGASLSVAIGTDAQKGSTGTQAKTGVGFLPEALLLCGNAGTVLGTVADGLSYSMGVAHGSSNRVSNGVSQNGTANSVTGGKTLATKCISYISDATPTTVAEASLETFDADGYTLNWSTADATQRLFGFVALAFTTTVTITSNGGGNTASVNAAENQTAVTTVVATTTGNTVAYSITGGADQAKFNIGSSTGVLTFKVAPNYEAPTDANADNQYVVAVTATDGSATDSQTITVTVTNVSDSGSMGPACDEDDEISFGH